MAPAVRNIEIRRGDVFRQFFAFTSPVNGRAIDDLVITNGSTAVLSASGFVDADDGAVISILDESGGIVDGTTLTVITETSGALSAAATVTASNVRVSIGGLDCTGYTDHLAEVRTDRDADAVMLTLTVDDARADVGVFLLSAISDDTEALTAGGVWDWQADGPNGIVTLLEGRATLVKDVARP